MNEQPRGHVPKEGYETDLHILYLIEHDRMMGVHVDWRVVGERLPWVGPVPKKRKKARRY